MRLARTREQSEYVTSPYTRSARTRDQSEHAISPYMPAAYIRAALLQEKSVRQQPGRLPGPRRTFERLILRHCLLIIIPDASHARKFRFLPLAQCGLSGIQALA